MSKPKILKGMRDFFPGEMQRREYVLSLIKQVFKSYGFLPIETPAIEYWDILSGKYGDEEKLIYKFKDRGERDVGLRFDFTVPLARVISMHPEITMPFRRYQIQPVWRADKPQKGRMREFYQCDIDIVGTSSILADAEIISITSGIFEKLGFSAKGRSASGGKEFKIIVNNRKILSAICQYAGIESEKELEVCRTIDKVEKIGKDGVKEELEERGIRKECINNILSVLEINSIELLEKEISGFGDEGIKEMKELFSYLKYFEIPKQRVSFSLWLARGLDYYTGSIFETVVEKPRIGSLAGGGRFDKLIGKIGNKDIPAVGTTIGLERVITVMEEQNMFPSLEPQPKVLITQFDKSSLKYVFNIARDLRENGIETEVYPDFVKLSKQFRYARKRGIPYVVVAGPDEIRENKMTIKDMKSERQELVDRKGAIEWFKDNLPTVRQGGNNGL